MDIVARNKGKQETPSTSSSYSCNTCCDNGWILKKREDGSCYAIPCLCREKNKVRDQWKAAGLNVENKNLTFGNFIVWNDTSKKSKDIAVRYFKSYKKIKSERRNSIILCGQVGSGKTHLAVALAINFLQNNHKVVYMPYRDVITKVKQNILDKEYYKKIISKYQTAEILLVDDLFKGKINESDINIMFEIINYRYLNHLPMIINSEFEIEKLLYFDEAIGSRIYEMCKDFMVEIKKDQRNNFRLRPL